MRIFTVWLEQHFLTTSPPTLNVLQAPCSFQTSLRNTFRSLYHLLPPYLSVLLRIFISTCSQRSSSSCVSDQLSNSVSWAFFLFCLHLWKSLLSDILNIHPCPVFESNLCLRIKSSVRKSFFLNTVILLSICLNHSSCFSKFNCLYRQLWKTRSFIRWSNRYKFQLNFQNTKKLPTFKIKRRILWKCF